VVRRIPAVLALLLLAASCTGSEPTGQSPPPEQVELVAQVASADLFAGQPQRVLVGMFANDGRIVTFGTVRFSFSYVGTAEDPVDPAEPGPAAEARYIPTPGTPSGEGGAASLSQPSEARGVYQATDVTFPMAGFWQVTVDTDVEGVGTARATSAFEVRSEPQIPAPGDDVLPTENLTLDSKGVPAGAIDSIAAAGADIPDPELHTSTIADALDERKSMVVVFATPAYCISRFCGPVVSAIQDLADRFGGSAVYIHVEIWRDYENGIINDAAAEWLQLPSGDLTEPWIYMIDDRGVIVDRWNSLFDPAELAAYLQ